MRALLNDVRRRLASRLAGPTTGTPPPDAPLPDTPSPAPGPTDAPIAPAPDWLLDLIRPVEPVKADQSVDELFGDAEPSGPVTDDRAARVAKGGIRRETDRLDAMREAATPNGEGYTGAPWDETTFRVACSMLELANIEGSGYTRDDVLAILLEHAPTDDGFTQADVRAKFDSAVRKVGDKARVIESRLRREYGYTLELLDERQADPLAHFLFERKKGHCEYFASALAVMLRTQGIPSRVATGFLSGTFNPISGWQVIRASDAHSWVEAWIPERGWITRAAAWSWLGGRSADPTCRRSWPRPGAAPSPS